MKRLLKGLLAMAMCASMAACSTKTSDGTFEGESTNGIGGSANPIKVSITLKDGVITDVTAEGAGETEGIGTKVLESFPEQIKESGSIALDSMSGATVTSEAFLEAAEAALKKAGVNPEDYKTEITAAAGEAATYDVDVAIIGAGGAGMTAAITAAQAGKTVLIMEKGSIVGGNTARSTGGMNAAKTHFQDENEFGEDSGVEAMLKKAEAYEDLADLAATVKEQYEVYKAAPEGYFDSVELFMLDTMVGGKNLNNIDLVSTLAGNSSEAIDWLASLDTPINLTNVAAFGGASVKRIHRPVDENGKTKSVGAYIVPLLEENVNNLGVTVLLETEAKEIVTDDSGAVVGVVGEHAGATITVNAKAVVLASGGFGANLEKVAELNPALDGFITTNVSTITGDGIAMAEALGANTVDMDQIQIHPTVLQSNGALITEGLRGDGAILVNQEGERFCNDTGTRDEVSAAELAQTGGYAYLIVDQKMIDASTVIQGYIKKDYTLGGDAETLTGTDIDTLAGLMEVDAEALKATIEKWNACVAAKEDADWGRTSFANPLEDAFIAIKIAPGVHHTMGGVEINTNAEVINTDGEVIPGLFAAGEVTGGVHGANRLGGNAVADIVVFGKIAGASASAYAK